MATKPLSKLSNWLTKIITLFLVSLRDGRCGGMRGAIGIKTMIIIIIIITIIIIIIIMIIRRERSEHTAC